jgi:hypothetical protein
MKMAPWRVTNRLDKWVFPNLTDFPPMSVAHLENVNILPFAPPFLPRSGQLITDYLIPWSPDYVPWFKFAGDGFYSSNVDIDTDGCHYEIDTAFYMDHSIAAHFGHFIGDCVPRLHAWDVCRAIFGDDIKVIVGHDANRAFHDYLFQAAGVPPEAVVRTAGLGRIRRLLLPSQSLSLGIFASPTSARLFATMRDRMARRDVTMPDRVYLSRMGVKDRKLANEEDVERIFQRHGFTIVRPETLSIAQQVNLVSNAGLLAGCSGSGLFSLAFQGRLRSAFILIYDSYLQNSELLLSAGRQCEITYHMGSRVSDEQMARGLVWSVDLARLETEVANWVSPQPRTGILFSVAST